ncbi:MAG: hypothetical protein KC646_13330 [Candidatus Cloacimonetes bacterium]|nr:hypothetical protein [Candidatus Cloacimonadota bacterium]
MKVLKSLALCAVFSFGLSTTVDASGNFGGMFKNKLKRKGKDHARNQAQKEWMKNNPEAAAKFKEYRKSLRGLSKSERRQKIKEYKASVPGLSDTLKKTPKLDALKANNPALYAKFTEAQKSWASLSKEDKKKKRAEWFKANPEAKQLMKEAGKTRRQERMEKLKTTNPEAYEKMKAKKEEWKSLSKEEKKAKREERRSKRKKRRFGRF